MDSGSIREMSPAEALHRYRDKLRERWSKWITRPDCLSALEDFLGGLR